jgi:hypothetical protein
MKYRVTIEQQEAENGWAESITGEVDDRNLFNLIRETAPTFLRGPEDRLVLQIVPEGTGTQAPANITVLEEEVE